MPAFENRAIPPGPPRTCRDELPPGSQEGRAGAELQAVLAPYLPVK